MKMRAIKARRARHVSTKIVLATFFPIFRRKDNVRVGTTKTEAEAVALLVKAKAAKKASLYIGTPYRA